MSYILDGPTWSFCTRSLFPGWLPNLHQRPKLEQACFGFPNRRLGDTPTDDKGLGRGKPMAACEDDAETALFAGLMEDAHKAAKGAASMSSAILGSTPRMSLNREAEALRWFYFPHEHTSLASSRRVVISPKLYNYGRQGGKDQSVSASPPGSAVELRFASRELLPEASMTVHIFLLQTYMAKGLTVFIVRVYSRKIFISRRKFSSSSSVYKTLLTMPETFAVRVTSNGRLHTHHQWL